MLDCFYFEVSMAKEQTNKQLDTGSLDQLISIHDLQTSKSQKTECVASDEQESLKQ